MDVVVLGSGQRVRCVHRTNHVATGTLRLVGGLTRPNVAANRLSRHYRRCVHDYNTFPDYGNCCKFPTAVYTDMGRRIIRNVPNRHGLGSNSVVDVSLMMGGGNCRNSSAMAVPINRIHPTALGLLGIARRDLCGNVRRTMTKGRLNSVNRTIRSCTRSFKCNIIHSCINRNVNASVRRSPRIPGCNVTNRNRLLRPNVILTVRPVVGVNARGIHRLGGN